MTPARRTVLRVIVGCVTLALASAGNAAAQDAVEGDPPPDKEKNEGRSLAGHRFIPSELLVDPFAATYFRSTSGYGYVESTGPNFDRLGNLFGTRDYTQALLTQTFELEVAPLSWLALRAGATSIVYSGVDATSVITLGANVDLHGRGGVTLTLPTAKWIRPALVFDIERGPVYGVNLLASVRASIDAGEIVRASAIETGNLTVLTPGVAAAFAVHRAFGIVLNAVYVGRTGEDVDEVQEADGYGFGMALDVDFKALTFIPIGVMGAFQWSDDWADNHDATKAANLGVYYTARPDLVLGLIAGVRDLQQRARPRFESTVWLAQVTVRYYW